MCIYLDNLKERNSFLKSTNHNNILTRPIWEAMDFLPMFKNCQKDELLNTRFLESRIVTIPSSVI